MNKPSEIALAFPRGAHQEHLIEGVIQYATENNCRWSYLTAPESLLFSILDLKGWGGKGVIAALNTEEELRCARLLSMPVVNISSALHVSPVPSVNVDNLAIGELAGNHFVSRGFSHFAFYGLENVEYSDLREKGYRSRLPRGGGECYSFYALPTFGLNNPLWHKQNQELADWLVGLPTPVALFTVSDYRSRQVLELCRSLQILVPQQFAILGVDNEEVICQHTVPQLSSIARNDRAEGYQAAAMLHRLLNGSPHHESVRVPPAGVVERASTQTVSSSQTKVHEAIGYVVRNLGKPFGVDQVAAHIGVSRRWLEYTFREAIGESPYQYIRRQRLERARQLLIEDPSAKVYEIAQRSGFKSSKQFIAAFRQRYSVSPLQYRKSLVA